MRVLLYEWCSSGGLVGDDPSIAREGQLMLQALAADAAKAPDLEIAVLVDASRPIGLPRKAHRIPVRAGDDRATLVAAAREADWTIIVAPESDHLLLDRVRAVRGEGGRVLAPADEVIALAADKQATIDALAARGLPVPAGRSLASGEPVPRHFHLPAIRKARGGCGCEELVVVSSSAEPPSPKPVRIEARAEGTPVGVSLLCGPQTTVPLPVMRQQFSTGNRPRYLGSDLLADAGAAARATALARRAAAAVGADLGWLGVDIILGARADGRDDRVLEVNPRITTSIVGQSRLFAASLVGAMIAAATGATRPLGPAVHDATAGNFKLDDR